MTPVRLDAVSRTFNKTTAVDSVSLDIPAGEIFFLLGPSGCGKTTLLRMIAGLLEPSSGRIYFGDRDVTSLPTGQRNAVMCFQSYALWPNMTVAQNVAFGLEARAVKADESRRRVEEALRQVQMSELAQRKPAELSGGQQQRVALARALVVGPDCLLLDEPLSNLDAKLRLEMRGEIRRICKQAGLTAIYVTHDQKEALSIADRMAIMNRGRIEQVGSPGEIYRRPASVFAAQFMGEANLIEGQFIGMESSLAAYQTPVGRLLAAVSKPPVSGSRAILCIRPEAIRIAAGSNELPASLHDTLYLGDLAQHRLELPGGVDWTMTELNPRYGSGGSGRQAVRICIDPADITVISPI